MPGVRLQCRSSSSKMGPWVRNGASPAVLQRSERIAPNKTSASDGCCIYPRHVSETAQKLYYTALRTSAPSRHPWIFSAGVQLLPAPKFFSASCVWFIAGDVGSMKKT
jgi:hypothetical protein